MFWAGFIVGVFVGCAAGLFIMVLCMAGKSDPPAENEEPKNEE